MRSRAIAGFEEYSVTEDGRIISYKHGGAYELHPGTDSRGYASVIVFGKRGEGIKRTCRVHRAVLEAFKPDTQGLGFTNHIDGDKANNNLANLEWVTKSQNTLHAYRLGLMSDRRGTKNGRAKLDEVKASEIKALLRKGCYQKDIATMFGIHQSHVSRIARGETWGEVT